MDIPQSLYSDLRRIAAHYLRREARGHTHQPTSLVNEACLRLRVAPAPTPSTEVLAIASRIMRQVLVDHARRRHARKRSSTGVRIPLTPEVASTAVDRSPPDQLLALDAALARLAAVDPDLARIVELRYFGGLSEAQAAAHLEISIRTVSRRLQVARLFLARHIRQEA